MLGSSQKFAPGTVRNWSLGLAGLAAASFLAPGTASAADCINGYVTLPNQVILQCEGAAPVGQGAFAFDRSAQAGAPVVAAPAAPAAAVPRQLMAGSRDECQPGMYWGYDMVESGDVILAC